MEEEKKPWSEVEEIQSADAEFSHAAEPPPPIAKPHLALHLAFSLLLLLKRSKYHRFLPPSPIGLPPLVIDSKERTAFPPPSSAPKSQEEEARKKSRSLRIAESADPSGMDEIPSLIQDKNTLRRRNRSRAASAPLESHALKEDSSVSEVNDQVLDDGSLPYGRKSHVVSDLKDSDINNGGTIDRLVGYSTTDPKGLWVEDIADSSDGSSISLLSSVNRNPNPHHPSRRQYRSLIDEGIESQKSSMDEDEYRSLTTEDGEIKKDNIDEDEQQRDELSRKHYVSHSDHEDIGSTIHDDVDRRGFRRNSYTPRRRYVMEHNNKDWAEQNEYVAENSLSADESGERGLKSNEIFELEGFKDDEPIYSASQDDMSSSLLLWPVGLAVRTVGFQIRLFIQVLSLIGSIASWCTSFTSQRVQETIDAKERAKEALNQKVSMIAKVPPKVAENGSILLRRAGWGCLAATYVCFLLCMLLLPALVLDYVFLNRVVEEPVSIREPLHFDYTLDHPEALVSLSALQGSLNQVPNNGKPALALHREHFRAIPPTHKVHVTVILTLPESDYNRNLGMFQLTAELLSESGEYIKSSSRPCMLRFHSEPIRWLKTLLLGLPSLVGIGSESQTLVIKLTEFGKQRIPVGAVRILLQSKAGMAQGQGIPEIYFADVHIESKLSWLKNLLLSWKWTVYIWMGLVLYIIEVVMVLCCCRRTLVPRSWVSGGSSTGTMSENGTDHGHAGASPPKTENDVKLVHPRQSSRRRRILLDDDMPVASVKRNDVAARQTKKVG